MIRCFLSHSSKDKKSYVKIVADKLGKQTAVYDEYTFEEGMKSLDEILKNIDSTQLVVIFLSDNSLNSDWVKREIIEAEERVISGVIKQIYPFIIDKKINFKDDRIPQWMRDEYNLKLVSQPTVAARRIRQRLREISWEYHPRLRERRKIFVGRNDQMKEFEERMDDFDLSIPSCIIAAGMKNIGRRTFLRHALVKSNIVSESYNPSFISLGRHESLEDFLLKIHDLGFTNKYDLTNLLEKNVEEKISIAINILREIQNAREILFIIDDGCIINYKRDISSWFGSIVKKLDSDKLLFAIAASYRPLRVNINKPYIFVIDLPELTIRERKGLFKRYLDFDNINLSTKDFSFFCELLYGYPEQVVFAVDFIKDFGLRGAIKESHQIQEYNAEKASIILQKYNEDNDILDFIYLLSEFEFISFDLLYEIVDEVKYASIVDDLLARAILDSIGIEQEFIRLNDAIRDYVRRGRFGIPEKFKPKLLKHVEDFIQTEDKFDRDVSDYIYSVKSALTEGKEISSKYLIPSHFLSTMRDLYQQRGHFDRVIELADMILQKESSLDQTIKEDIQYYLCLALARKRDKRFLKEVQNIHGAEHNFLLGFYYRLTRRHSDALEKLEMALDSRETAIRAKRELVQVYLYTEDYHFALDLAEENYEENRDNPYHIQAYFNCLINLDDPTSNRDKLDGLIEELELVGSKQAIEMGKIAKALLYAKCDGDYVKAVNVINDAINSYPESPHSIISKFEILLIFKKCEEMEEVIKKMEILSRNGSIYKDTLVRARCLYYACKGNKSEAVNLINNELINFPRKAKERLMEKIYSF